MKWDDFIGKHAEIDKDIKKEKAKGLLIHRIFFFIDIVITISLVCIEGLLDHKYH